MKNPLKKIERLIDGTTMYRVMLYTLGAIAFWALLMSVVGKLSVSWLDLLASFVIILGGAVGAHFTFAKLMKAPANLESSVITALILFLILTPSADANTLVVNAVVGILAIASKYIFTYRLRHVFNPVAIALVIAGVAGYIGVEWWVSSRYMLPIVLLAALVVVVKTDRWRLVGTYVGVSTVLALFLFKDFATIPETLAIHFFSWPTVFFAAFMLTEPLGLPSNRRLEYVYASVVALLGTIPFTLGPVHGTPELALVAANLLTLVADRPARFKLTFTRRIPIGPQTFEYRFAPSYPVIHKAGQYLEWTIPHHDVDSRGIRRYLTIVTPPGAEEVGFAIKHLDNQSSWKKSIEALIAGTTMFATGRAGNFILPQKQNGPIVLIAGGIGITPFMSMLRSNPTLSATLFFCNNTVAERCYVDELERARAQGFKTVFVTTSEKGEESETEAFGFITADMFNRHVTDWKKATFFISGPPGMVAAYEHLLTSNQVPKKRIITDYFPGLA